MNPNHNNKKTLFVINTHGDESIGNALVNNIKNQNTKLRFDTIVANPKATKQNMRFLKNDLNRIVPGDINSDDYETKRAAELMGIFKKYDFLVDFHETKANDRIVIILPKITKLNLALALCFDIPEIIYWPPSNQNKKTGPLVQYVPCGIEIESGTKTSFENTAAKLSKTIKNFLNEGFNNFNLFVKNPLPLTKNKKIYKVYGKIQPQDMVGVTLKDFQEIEGPTGKFIPLLFGRKQGLLGYKIKKIELKNISNTSSIEL